MKRLITGILLVLSLFGNAPAIEQPNLPSAFDMIMLAGADYAQAFQIRTSSGVIVNMTGKTFAAQFRAATAPAGALYANFSTVTRIPFTTYSGLVTSYPAVIDVKLSKAQTTRLSGKSGVWDLKQTDSSGLVSYILTGKAVVRPTVTQ
jgi:hypothetical protein